LNILIIVGTLPNMYLGLLISGLFVN